MSYRKGCWEFFDDEGRSAPPFYQTFFLKNQRKFWGIVHCSYLSEFFVTFPPLISPREKLLFLRLRGDRSLDFVWR